MPALASPLRGSWPPSASLVSDSLPKHRRQIPRFPRVQRRPGEPAQAPVPLPAREFIRGEFSTRDNKATVGREPFRLEVAIAD